jgi:transcriptional regulator with XRE-family HTH domain
MWLRSVDVAVGMCPSKHPSAPSESPCRWGYWQGLPAPALPGYADPVDAKSEIREFLTSRRAKLTPDEVSLTSYGPRRVPGLRREEVAVLAGVSVPYYTRLERGNLSGVSESVLEALARALQLDEAERSHLFDLARAAQPTTPARRRPRKERIRPSVQRMLDAITGAPAAVLNGRLDMLATNTLARGLYSEMYVDPVRPVNHARFVFLSPRAPDFYVDCEREPPTPSPSCARRPVAIPTTAICRTSSASSRPAARNSARAGPRTTSASTGPARRPSTTRSSVTSP